MGRIEKQYTRLDSIVKLLDPQIIMLDENTKRSVYVHLYGVGQESVIIQTRMLSEMHLMR